MSRLPLVGPFADDRESERFAQIISDAFAMPLERWRPYFEGVGRENFRVIRAGLVSGAAAAGGTVPAGGGTSTASAGGGPGTAGGGAAPVAAGVISAAGGVASVAGATVPAGTAIAGGLAVLPMGQFFGGRSVPCGGVAVVATVPEHRARGTATALLRAMLEEQRARGVPLSALYPATLALYRRVGYERAGYLCELCLPLRTLDVRDRTLELRPVEPEDGPRLRALYRQWAAGTNGNLDRSDFLARRGTEYRGDPGRGFVVLRDGSIEGYVYVVTPPGDPLHAVLRIPDLVAVTPSALRRLLTLLADYRTTRESATIFTGPADPLLMHLAEAHYTLTVRAGWMLRIVDVRGALEARGWAAGVRCELHLDVADEILPENAGRWTVRIADGRATVAPGGRGTLRMHERGLAALYTGYLSPADLALAGLLSGPDDELAAAATAFAGPAPWMRDTF